MWPDTVQTHKDKSHRTHDQKFFSAGLLQNGCRKHLKGLLQWLPLHAALMQVDMKVELKLWLSPRHCYYFCTGFKTPKKLIQNLNLHSKLAQVTMFSVVVEIGTNQIRNRITKQREQICLSKGGFQKHPKQWQRKWKKSQLFTMSPPKKNQVSGNSLQPS